jgi:hypothetical protein
MGGQQHKVYACPLTLVDPSTRLRTGFAQDRAVGVVILVLDVGCRLLAAGRAGHRDAIGCCSLCRDVL